MMNALRKKYLTIRSRICYETGCSRPEFDDYCRELVPDATSGTQWVAAARRVRIPCGRCAGTGQFITMVENGKPKGPGGICFRCNGQGTQNYDDARRNYGHDINFVPRGM